MHAVDPRSAARFRSEARHAFACACGYQAISADPETILALQATHACPANPLDVVADRLISRRGLAALVIVIVFVVVLVRLPL